MPAVGTRLDGGTDANSRAADMWQRICSWQADVTRRPDLQLFRGECRRDRGHGVNGAEHGRNRMLLPPRIVGIRYLGCLLERR